jgi:hypothetical protein
MSGFSIDLSAERIVDHRTRSYFVEVVRSFSNECYRSSIVMLWTTVVCDLVYKLQSLRDLYGDTAAGKLLEDVEKKREANPNSPDWEVFLLDEVAKRTKMLETSEHAQLQHLQKLRHLSAHPVLNVADLLFTPTKEDARAQIRLALEALLLKPALFSKRIVETLVEDIAANKDVLISRDKLRAYLKARYLPNMPRPIEIELFRALWKFCFKLNNADTKANRKINLETLAILFGRNPAAMREAIDAERAFFSNVGPDAEPLDALVGFLADHPDLYASLDPAAHVLIDGRLDAEIDNLAKSRFKTPDMGAVITALDEKTSNELARMSDEVWLRLLTSAEKEGVLDDAVRLALKVYGDSPNYDSADRSFAVFIEPVLSKLTADTMGELLGAIEKNQQTYGRGRASVDHPQIKDAADALGVDTTTYERFTKYI